MLNLNDVKICVVGLGYVGLPLARLFSTRYPVVGYDKNSRRVQRLNEGHDETLEVSEDELKEALESRRLRCSAAEDDIKDCNVYIVAVPTPVDDNNRPDLEPLLQASAVVGRALRSQDVVIFESTVYPGVTEEECIPVVEKVSGLKFNEDFYAGYSPERINPGDRQHRVESIRKVTSGSTPEAAQMIDQLYNSVLKNGTHLAPSIKVAEASKIVENTQRDVNIAFVNELAKIFNAMGIDTRQVLDAASTKWNFIPMEPGLVGGHCISVDPYYLIQKSQLYGVLPRVMMDARRVNNSMGNYIAMQCIRLMNLKGIMVKNARMLIAGFSFKENCPDIRNSKVVDIFHTLADYSGRITVFDPWVDPMRAEDEYGIRVVHKLEEGIKFDAAILATRHDCFRRMSWRKWVPEPGVIYDVKGIADIEEIDGRL